MDGFLFPSFLVVDVMESFHVQECWASTGVWFCFCPIFLLTGLNLRIEHSVHEFKFNLNLATPYMINNNNDKHFYDKVAYFYCDLKWNYNLLQLIYLKVDF